MSYLEKPARLTNKEIKALFDKARSGCPDLKKVYRECRVGGCGAWKMQFADKEVECQQCRKRWPMDVMYTMREWYYIAQLPDIEMLEARRNGTPLPPDPPSDTL